MGLKSWWNMLWGRHEAQRGGDTGDVLDPDAPAREVGTHDLGDGLTVHQYFHAIHGTAGPVAVRTLLTDGLAAMKAREIRVTVPAEWSDATVGAAGKLLSTLRRLTAEGRPAMLGGWTGFQISELAGGAVVGVTYARGTPILGIPGAEAALAAVLLHHEELELVQQGLATRVLGRLATRARYFPYPPCWDVRTEPVLRASEQAGSLLEKLPRASIGDLRVTVEESPADGEPATTVRLSLPENARDAFAKLWSDPALRGLALTTMLAPQADGQATWVPGSPDRTANSLGAGPPKRMGFAFVMLAPTGAPSAELRYIEDGIGLLLPDGVLDRLREALIAGEPLTLPLGERSQLVVELRSHTLEDPFSGSRLHAEGGWEQYRPDVPVQVKELVLLFPVDELRDRIEVAALAAFTRSIEQVLDRLAERHPVGAPLELAILLTLRPERRHEVRLAFRGARQEALLTSLVAEVEGLAAPPVRGEVPFRLDVTVQPPAS